VDRRDRAVRRDLLARAALAQIPKLLTLQDRNPHSPTFGCFDRNHWHYKIIDFPSGMAQEFAYPLALAYDTDLPDNPFFQKAALVDFVQAGISFAARSAHADGSCDDYFPYERAGGAAGFSLLACLESTTLLDLENSEALRFFELRATWLANHHETGTLTNHQALIALCLELAGRRLGTDRWKTATRLRIERVLEWQSSEGWYREYEGCDPGYLSLTVSLLARLDELDSKPELRTSLKRAVDFLTPFIHPDGSTGGEYASRNTYGYFPHGLELVGRWLPRALALNDRYLVGLASGKAAEFADDHTIGHHVWNYLLAWRDFADMRGNAVPDDDARQHHREAGLLVDRRGEYKLYVALNKGGVFKLFRGNRLVVSDTQFSLRIESEAGDNIVGHLVDDYDTVVEADLIRVSGRLGYAKQKPMTPFNLIVLRLVMLSVGRFFPKLIRRLLQRMLITGKRRSEHRFTRTFRWAEGAWVVVDELQSERWDDIQSIGIGPDQTSIYVVMSRTFQPGQLQPWFDLTERVKSLRPGDVLRLERRW
jgi:hypothetical protein